MPDSTEQHVTSTLVEDLLQEKRADRRWKNIRFLAWFFLIAYVLTSMFHFIERGRKQDTVVTGSKYVSLIRLDGMIAPGREFSADELLPVLHEAFQDKRAEGVIISINSPGGTPVQAAIIHDAILNLKHKYKKKVVIVGEDLLTSGAYYVSVAGDQIYVNPNTLTGSIGVIMKGFGFVDLMKKLGIERRVYTMGSDKDRLDPFLPQTPDDLAKIQQVMGEVHQNFIEAVTEGRKGKLHGDPKQLFSGDFWSGQTAMKLGLVDHLGNLTEAMEKEFGTVHYKEYGTSSGIMKLLGGQIASSFDAVMYAS